MKWLPSPDEPGKWRLLRKAGAGEAAHVATVERSDCSPLIGAVAYRGEVLVASIAEGYFSWQTEWKQSRILFNSLKEAQLWCEQEVRLMEVGELV